VALIGSGRISPGQVDRFNVMFRSNVTYAIYVRPDRSNVDFDLHIYDQNGYLVQYDEAPDSDAVCFVTPRWTGPFQVVVNSAVGTSSYNLLIEP
jgi:hypothetical protein